MRSQLLTSPHQRRLQSPLRSFGSQEFRGIWLTGSAESYIMAVIINVAMIITMAVVTSCQTPAQPKTTRPSSSTSSPLHFANRAGGCRQSSAAVKMLGPTL